MSIMSWSQAVPGPRGHELRRVLLGAMEEVYEENVRRFAPDELGDNNITFGVNVSQNLRHVVERDTGLFLDVVAERPRNSFILRIDDRFTVHFYKAPPGVLDLRALTFDESDLKLEIRQDNADQLSFDFHAVDEAATTTVLGPTHVVIVHFGGPSTGFQFAEVGAPYSTDTGHCDWVWHERFDDQGAGDGDNPIGEGVNPPHPPRGGQPRFGLRLRDVSADDDVADS